MIDYSVMYKGELPVTGLWPADVKWDIFISAYTAAERVRDVYEKAPAQSKHWLLSRNTALQPAIIPAGLSTPVFVKKRSTLSLFGRSPWEILEVVRLLST